MFGEPTIVILPDSAWRLMYRPESPLWDVPLGKSSHPPGEILSMGIGMWDRKGILYNKTALECTREELKEEVWAQMKQSRGLLLKHFKTDNGLTHNDVECSSYNIWHSFSYNHGSGILDTREPKFSNNVGTLALRPCTRQDGINNLVHATGYVMTDTGIFNMDSAAEAGIRAANYIADGKLEADNMKYVHPGMFWGFCQHADRLLLKMGFRNIFELLLKI